MARRRPFRRTDRLSSQIKQVLAVAVQREAREDVLHSVVVTDVDVTPDLSLARVYYYAMSGDPALIEAALGRAANFLRRRVGEEIRARHTPELRFHVDTAIDRGRRVEEILHQIATAGERAGDDVADGDDADVDGDDADADVDGDDAEADGDDVVDDDDADADSSEG